MGMCLNPMHWESDIDYVATDRENTCGEKVRQRSKAYEIISSKEGNDVEPPLSTSSPCRQNSHAEISVRTHGTPTWAQPGPVDGRAMWLIHPKEWHSKAISR